MAEVRIEQSGARATVAVDGVTLKGVTRLAVEMVPNSLPLVTLDLAAFSNSMELADAVLKIGGIEAPEALERAMYEHLRKKFDPWLAFAHGGPMPEGAALLGDFSAGDEMTGMPVPAAGSLPTSAEMASAVRSVVQSVAADLVRLPVRQATPEHAPGPSGLTTIAPIGAR